MMVQEGNLLGTGKKFAIIGSRFNEFITSKLIGGAEDCLLRHDVKQEDITVIWVPGAYEIPLIAKKAALSGKYDAVICVGAVIRGATTHYDYVCNEVAKGIAHVSLETGIPVMFGVVTTENIEQAMQEGYSTAPANVRALGFGAGMGLPNIKKYTDSLHIESEVGKGTTIYMTVQVNQS